MYTYLFLFPVYLPIWVYKYDEMVTYMNIDVFLMNTQILSSDINDRYIYWNRAFTLHYFLIYRHVYM